MTTYKLSGFEATVLIINLLCCKLFLLTPLIFTENSGSGALITVCFIFVLAFLVFGIYVKKSGGKPVFSLIGNPFVRAVFGALSCLLLVFCGAVTFSRILYYAKAMAYPKTPLVFLALPLGISSVLCARTGLKSVGKTHGFFVPLLYAVLIVLVLLSAKSFRFTGLTPVLGKGFYAVFGSGFFLLSSLFESLVLFYLPAFTNAPIKKVGFSALSASFAYYLFVIGGFLLIGGKAQTLPLFSVIRASFFSRTDSLFLLLYATAGMLYLASVIYFSAFIFAKTFKVPHVKPLIIPIALIILSFAEISFFNPEEQFVIQNMQKILWVIPFLLPVCFACFKPQAKHKKEDIPCEKH